ncbi:pentapeptide repeat-containing protein [Leptolyngbya sp. FACHB-541]|uniref:pentapeptide repeat-containing protein n=1 Tax=Leptolyngbya sp. FACHB-541 TaxID=2692810 RepID=UPI0018EF87F0|nr:pentapeptide repeat-containing protein [Leptolyngbya sp. FACHB-541]
MAAGVLKGFWQFLNTDIRELPWGELTTTGAESAQAIQEFGLVFKEQAPKIQELAPLAKDIQPFLNALDSPIVQLVGAGLPFVSIGVTLAKLYLEHSKQDPTLIDSVLLVSQIAFLASLEDVLNTSDAVKNVLGNTPLKKIVERQIRYLDAKALTESQAKKALVCFQESDISAEFSQALREELQETGLNDAETQTFTDRVAWNTPRYLYQALAEAADQVKPLADLYRMGGQEALDKFTSIDEYLRDYISPDSTEPELRNRWRVFDESFILKDLYVPLNAQRIDRNGEPVKNKKPVVLEEWAKAWLDDDQRQDRVLFVQGGPGRGKSAFCRMFAEWVRQYEHPRWTPILIRLRDVSVLQPSFEATLQDVVKASFARYDRWLFDRSTRFLFLLDGFDELLMEGRTSGGLEKFLKQVGTFQQDCSRSGEMGHRVVVTGRTLSLHSVERDLPNNLERVELLPMNEQIQDRWFVNWAQLAGSEKSLAFQQFLQNSHCPERIRGTDEESGLAQEPLVLYLLAAMHRDRQLKIEDFEGVEGVQAKIRVYQNTLDWVLTEQRPEWLNRQITELDTENLRRILAEAGLCVVQSGSECASLATIEKRLKGNNTAKALLEEARNRIKDNPLRNALAAFYMQPGRSGEGSVEFIHKSFGEFLCAERLKESLEDWSKSGDRRREFYISRDEMDWELYDLLGYGGLTPEIVEYLMAMLTDSPEVDPEGWIRLFQRLNEFYERWCEGELIDAQPENLPQKKMCLLRDQRPEQEKPLGLRQVDVFTGLNVLILLLELHRYAQAPEQPSEELKQQIFFYPSGQLPEEAASHERTHRLLKIVHYADCLESGLFTQIAGSFLSRANLSSAKLPGTNLSRANLSGANFSSANLSRAYLSGAKLSDANLSSAYIASAYIASAYLDRVNLSSANLYSANLDKANLSDANLSDAKLSSANLSNANLSRVNLSSAKLSRVNLSSAKLSSANLEDANLSSANLTNADLEGITWNEDTRWQGVRGLETARNVPAKLKEQLGLG